MPAEQFAFLETILEDPFWTAKQQSVTLLKYLAQQSAPNNNSEARTASAISTRLNLSAASVTTGLARLRDDLTAFFSTNRDSLRWTISLGPGGRGSINSGNNLRVKFEPNPSFRDIDLWADHLNRQEPLTIIANAPLFFRNSTSKHRIRVMQVNDPSAKSAHPILRDSEPCFHYMSIGDFRMVTHLVQHFSRHSSQPIETRIVYSSIHLEDAFHPGDNRTLDISQLSNAIVIGNPRVSWVMKELQTLISPNFALDEDDASSIFNRECGPNERPVYTDNLNRAGTIHLALVRHRSPTRTITLLSVQNGPALDALAPIVVKDSAIRNHLAKVGFQADSDQLPANFELLFQVELLAKEAPKPPVLLTSRPWGPNRDLVPSGDR